MRVGLGADMHVALGLKPQVQTSSKRFYAVSYVTCVEVASSRLGCCEETLTACGYNGNPPSLWVDTILAEPDVYWEPSQAFEL